MQQIEDPVLTVHVPQSLRHYCGGAEESLVSGFTVGEALTSLDNEHPGILAELLAPDGSVRSHINIFLGATPIRSLQGLATPVGFEELIAIVPAAG